MKKIFALVMAVILCFTLTACNEKAIRISILKWLMFENVEMFHFIVPADAEKKVITESKDIEGIYRTLESISLKDKATEPTAVVL